MGPNIMVTEKVRTQIWVILAKFHEFSLFWGSKCQKIENVKIAKKVYFNPLTNGKVDFKIYPQGKNNPSFGSVLEHR